MSARILGASLGLAALFAAGACASASTAPPARTSAFAQPRATAQESATPNAPQASTATARVRGTVVRFSARGAKVDVTIRSDHPTSRDFLSRLPMNIAIEEFAGREKISYLRRKLRTKGSPGSDPKSGDLIYFVPWGNLGFYYDASGVGYSEDTVNLGSYRATRRQLAALEGRDVRVAVLRRG